MNIIWFGHACFKVITDEGTAVFDPFSPDSVPGFSLPEISADVVFCSHGHHDHDFADGIALTGIKPSFIVKRIPSFHDDCMGAIRGNNLITLIEADGLKIAHFGDIGHLLSDKIINSIGTVDIAMIPVGGFYTVGPAEAMRICESVNSKIIIPMHYRGIGFGYDNIGTVQPFLDQFEDRDINRLSKPEFEIQTVENKQVIVFG